MSVPKQNQIDNQQASDSLQISELLKDKKSLIYRINHDLFFQIVFALHIIAVTFLKNVLPKETLAEIDLDKLEVKKGILGESDFFSKSVADLIYVVPYKNNDKQLHVSIILEHKSNSDPMTIFQLTKYGVHLMGRELEQAKKDKTFTQKFKFSKVTPVIIHQGRHAFHKATELDKLIIPLKGVEEYGINSKAILFDLNTICADDLKKVANVPEFISVIKMMQAAFSKHGSLLAREALEALRPYSKNPLVKEIIDTMLAYLYTCAEHVDRKSYKEIVYDDKYVDQGEINMPSAYEQMKREERAEGRAEGRVEGRVEGRAEGRAEGRVESVKKHILQALKFRFGSVPKSVKEEINSRCDSIALESLFQTALQVQTLDEFVKEL